MIYLRITSNNLVDAYADINTLASITGSENYDLSITEDEWAKVGQCAYVENGNIKLGYIKEVDGFDMSAIKNVMVSKRDSSITINGISLNFSKLNLLENSKIEDVVWCVGYGFVRYGGTINGKMGDSISVDQVIPYIKEYAKEQMRLWNIEFQVYESEVEQYNSEDARLERFELAREKLLQKYDFVVMQLLREQRLAQDANAREAITKELRAWDLYAGDLYAMNKLDGFPFDGGGINTPWPQLPQGIKGMKFKKETRSIIDVDSSKPKKPQFKGIAFDAESKKIAREFPVISR